MKNKIILNLVFIAVSCAALASAQWTPDPFCPYPSDHVTRYPYYGNCSVFWECYEGTKYVMECPEGLEFNAPLQECDAPEIARCNPYAPTTSNPHPPTYTTHSTSPGGPEPNCPFPSDEIIYFPYPGDCTRYWECWEGDGYLYTCPDGLWWHQAIENCDYPGSFCTDQGTTNPGQPVCRGSGSDPEFYPFYGDCTRYWECINGIPYIGDCPGGLWWHQAISECDLPGSYCSWGPTTKPTPPPDGRPDCTGVGSDPVFYPYYGNCSLYWECVNEQSYLGECAAGLWWNQAIRECDAPGDFCNYAPTLPPDDVVCPADNDSPVYFPYPGDCARYWECFEGVKYLNSCPQGLWWHQEVERCEDPGPFCQA